MYPGLSEVDCQVAGFHYRQLVNEGQRQQTAAGGRSASAGIRSVAMSLQRQFDTLLMRAVHRPQGMQAITRESITSTPTGEVTAIA